MRHKKCKYLILLCILVLSLSACAESTTTEPASALTVTVTATLSPTASETPMVQSTEPTLSLAPTVTPYVPEEPLPTITWVPTVTPMPTSASEPAVTFVPTVTPIPTSASTATPTPAPVKETPTASTFSVTYLDVGQGDSAIVECDGHYMLIDGGDKNCSSLLYTYLKRNGISVLDIVVASHAHSDHVGGLPGALNYAKANLVLCPVTEYDTEAFRDFAKYAGQNGPGITVPEAQAVYSLGSATVKIISLNAVSEGNDSSIIMSVTYQDTVFLFTGDAEREAEQLALNTFPEQLSAMVLKVGHHGSADATTYPFLREVMPTYAVISCGAGNAYGHPTDNTLSRLRDADVTVFRTDLHGDITISYNDGEWQVTTQKTVSAEDVFVPDEYTGFTDEDADTGSNDADNNESGNDTNRSDTGSTNDATDSVTDGADDAATGTSYIANKNSKVFHYPDCKSVKQMKESNKIYYEDVTREDMIAKGYKPCGNCNP